VFRIPFSQKLNDVFTSQRYGLLKILAGGFVGAVVSGRVAFDRSSEFSLTERIVFVMVWTAGAMIIVASLLLRDVVQQRIDEGLPVNGSLTRLFKGSIPPAVWLLPEAL
jgi:hypothetical protein